MICRHSFLQRTRWTTPTAGCSRRIFRRRQAARLQSTGRGPIWIPVFLHPLPWYLRRRSTPVPVQRLIACYFKRVAAGFPPDFWTPEALWQETSGKSPVKILFCLYRAVCFRFRNAASCSLENSGRKFSRSSVLALQKHGWHSG